MSVRYSRFLGLIHFAGDLLLLNVAFLAVFWMQAGVGQPTALFKDLNLFFFFNVAWVVLYLLIQPHKVGRAEHLLPVLKRHSTLVVLHLLLVLCHIFLAKGYSQPDQGLLMVYAIFIVVDFSWKISLLEGLRRYREKGYNYRNVVIMGYGELAEELKGYFNNHPEHGFRFQGIFDNHRTAHGVVGKMDALFEYVQNNKVDEIYCCLPYVKYSKVKELVDFADENLIKVKLIADFRGFSFKGVELERYDHIPVLSVSAIPLDNFYNQIWKRIFDVAFSTLVILFIFPWLFPIIATLIKLESPGPVFFKQKRSGLKNETFWCYKFRSMRVNCDSDRMQARKSDSRITKVGAFLRKTSLDELPQFFNVFLGNMSVVGPRPHMLTHTEEYRKQVNKFMARHFVKPGITGLAQAKGFRGETECISMMKHRIRLDRFYVDKWSVLFDVRIIVLTITSMLRGQDKAY